MFNPRAKISVVPLYGEEKLVIVDDLLLEPYKMVELASCSRAEFTDADHNYFPGPELNLAPEMTQAFDQFVVEHVRKPLGARRTNMLATRLALATLQPPQLQNLQRVCHRDTVPQPNREGTGAMVLYLFEDQRLGGTGFFRQTCSEDEFTHMVLQSGVIDRQAFSELTGAGEGYAVASDRYFDKIYTAQPAFNRAIFYHGTVLHSADIHSPALLRDDVRTGRLTVNAFFNLRRNAA
ncbi:DUF6445 family protein [Duganella sp. BuS-21]|uniref:DUF6445 family protein n=1 Tax=Duganella sp. BuS-21 TaxID=2943848 RepID=UPI0035A6656B